MKSEAFEPRIDYRTVVSEAGQAFWTVQRSARGSKIERPLPELVKLCASMMNGCTYCVVMHSKDARAGGESDQWLHALTVWRAAPFFTPREPAALAWTEAVTEVSAGHGPDEMYRLTRECR